MSRVRERRRTLLRKVHYSSGERGTRDKSATSSPRVARTQTHVVICSEHAVIAQPAMRSPWRSVGVASLAPCSGQSGSAPLAPSKQVPLPSSKFEGDIRSSEKSEARANDPHLLATTPSPILSHFGSALHPPRPSSPPSPCPSSYRSSTHFRSGVGSSSRGRMPGSVRAVLA